MSRFAERRENARVMFLRGKSLEAIALDLSCSIEGAELLLKAQGIDPHAHLELADEPAAVTICGAKDNAPVQALQHLAEAAAVALSTDVDAPIVDKDGRPLSPLQRQLVAIWPSGLSVPQIARKLTSTENTISAMVSKLRQRGIDLPNRAAGPKANLKLGEPKERKPRAGAIKADLANFNHPAMPAGEPIPHDLIFQAKREVGWTPMRLAVAIRLAKDGSSASEIMRTIGGVSRSAVLAKLNRLDISLHGRPPARPSTPREPREPRVKVEKSEKSPTPKPPVDPIAYTDKIETLQPTAQLINLGLRMCKWPIGDPQKKGFGFCGRSCPEEAPYCGPHAKRAYQPGEKTKNADQRAAKLARMFR